MNERIRELYNEAWLKVDPLNPQETFTNAFAELIVRECAEQICEGPFYAGAAAKYIKQHFGVEE